MNIQSAMVRSILERWRAYEWTTQGFGFIRTKLADVGRIHVWDSSIATAKVSTMHTHPWALRSTIISGELINLRFIEVEAHSRGTPYMRSVIATGEGGGLRGDPMRVRVLPESDPEYYLAGSVYEQKADEIHRSIPQDGTVTLLERSMGPPLEEAFVYWPEGTHWVSAEPRPAEVYEVDRVVGYALARWAAA